MSLTAYCPSPFGCFEIKGSTYGVRSIRLHEGKSCPSTETPEELLDCVQQLKEYFAKERQHFDLKLDWEDAPEFHKEVWKELMTIPYGRTTSYSAIAEKLGDANKMRAVGQANGRNRIPIVVPCHRVIAKNGNLHG